MPHFFIRSNSIKGNSIFVSDKDTFNHIVKSLRAKEGEKLLLIDENEIEYKTVISEIRKDMLAAEIISSEKSKRNLRYNLFLAQSPLKSDAQNTIIEKATELGIRGIYPIYTDNCALKKSVAESKIEKWQKIMYEASKQCERSNVPTCYPLTDLNTVLDFKNFDKIIALCEKNTNGNLKEYLRQNSIKDGENVLVIIGPEGGFSEDEFKLMEEKKLPMLSLGNLILKAETAVVVSIGNIIYEFS